MMMACLTILPDELLVSIVSAVADNKSLAALAQVSRKFQNLSENVLYSKFLLRSFRQCASLKRSIELNPRRATYVKVLDLRPRYNEENGNYGEAITGLLSQCFNLREVTLESPTCNYQRYAHEDYGWNNARYKIAPSLMDAMSQTSTRGLAKLVLHLDDYGNRYWDPNAGQKHTGISWSTVMALPTLTEMTISCACIHDNIIVGGAASSGLKKLTLVECNVTMEGLEKILSAPKALEYLYLGENAHHRGEGEGIPHGRRFPYNGLFKRDPDAFIIALSQQKDSLAHFSYVMLRSTGPKSIPLRGFRDFTQLREVALSPQIPEFQEAMVAHTGPPELVSLRLEIAYTEIFNGLGQLHREFQSAKPALTADDISEQMASKVSSALLPQFSNAALQRLEHLHIVLTDEWYIPDSVPPGLREQWIQLMSVQWLNHNIKLSLYTRESTSIIPPILYGEERGRARDLLCFSSVSGFVEGNTISRRPYR